MATAVSTPQVATVRASRWTYLLAYLALVTLAEVFIAIPGPAGPVDRPFQPIGLSMHILLVFSLLFLSVFQQTKDATLAALLVAVTVIPLGRLEYAILRPGPWIPPDSLGWLLGGAVVIFLATGLSEVLIFRGILLRRAVEALGGRSGLLYVTAIFASLHIFFL